MRYRPFGRLDVKISEIGFGGAAVSGEGGGYGFGPIAEADALDLVRRALDAGINLFDTAPIYGFGLSERRLGKALKGRHDVTIVTKCGIVWNDQKTKIRIDNSPRVTRQMLEQSLRDLGVEAIDLYLVHWPDPNVDIRSTVEVMERARQEGKIKAIGLSNTYPEDFAKASEIARIEVLQAELSLFQEGASKTLLPLAREHELGFMAWGPLDKGILTGRVTAERKFDRLDVRSHAPWWKNTDRTWKYEVMETLAPMLRSAGVGGLELALGYVLGFDECSAALCGVRTPEQLQGAIQALERLPDEEVIREAVELVAGKRPKDD